MTDKKSRLILVAEDDLFLAKAFEAKLQKAGFTVAIAKDGEETLSALKSKKPDLMLLDLIMPKMNGFEVLEAMRKDQALKKIPVIILSNLGQDADVKKGMALGAEDYFVKSNHSLQDISDKLVARLKK